MIRKIVMLLIISLIIIPNSFAQELIFITNVNVNDYEYPYVKMYNSSIPFSTHFYNYSESFIVSDGSTSYIYIKPSTIELTNSENVYKNTFNSYKYLIILFIFVCIIAGLGYYVFKQISGR